MFMVDMAHVAGLVAAEIASGPGAGGRLRFFDDAQNPARPAQRVRALQEGVDAEINSAVFPGIQGGPLMHVVAAKAVAFAEALQPSFRDYMAQIDRQRQSRGRGIGAPASASSPAARTIT